MAWPVGLGVVIVFLAVLAISRIVSLGSIAAAVSAVVLMGVLHQPAAYLLMAIAGAAFVTQRHSANIRRMLAGTEPRVTGSNPASRQ